MMNEDKRNRIRPWINPEERVTVHRRERPTVHARIFEGLGFLGIEIEKKAKCGTCGCDFGGG